MDLSSPKANDGAPDVNMTDHSMMDLTSPDLPTPKKTFIDLDVYESPISTGGAGTATNPLSIDEDSDDDCIFISSKTLKGPGRSISVEKSIAIYEEDNASRDFVKSEKPTKTEDDESNTFQVRPADLHKIIKPDESDSEPPKFHIQPEFDDIGPENAQSPPYHKTTNSEDSDSKPPKLYRSPEVIGPSPGNYGSPILKQPKVEMEETKPSELPKMVSSHNDKKRKRPLFKSSKTGRKRQTKKQKAEKDRLDLLSGLTRSTLLSRQPRARNEPLPEFMAKNRKDKFDNLLSNLPLAANRSNALKDKRDLNAAANSLGGKHKIGVVGDKWELKGMKSHLYDYQVMVAGQMVNMEKRNDKLQTSGGILADEMGLGKTVEMLAVFIAHPPGKEDSQTSLVIAPKAVISQWEGEIRKHSESLTVKIYDHTSKFSVHEMKHLYSAYNIILATPDQVARSMPPLKLKKDGEMSDEEWLVSNLDKGRVLHQMDWYRVVIDEVQCMKNYKSKRSLAAFALKAKHRWALSGTPVDNGLFEFYALMRFLRHPSAALRQPAWVARFASLTDVANGRLAKILSETMQRRTGETLLFGRPLLNLPEHTIKTERLHLLPDEEMLYQAVEARLRGLVNAQLGPGHPAKSIQNIRVQLTRLRQLVSQPLNIEEEIKSILGRPDLENIRERLLNLEIDEEQNGGRFMGKGMIQRIDGWIREKIAEEAKAADGIEAETKENLLCDFCAGGAINPHVINVLECQHIFCKVCIDINIEEQKDEDEEAPHRCPIEDCQESFEPRKDLKIWVSKNVPKKAAKFRKGRDNYGLHPIISNSKWMEDYDKGIIPLFMGAKMKFVESYIDAWLKEAPEEKFIIFAQFQANLATIGRMLQEKGVKFVYFMGSMSEGQRGYAIEKFQSKPQIKVMVSSLRCGGTGLNLAFASRVIMVDLWWNTALEDQAFGRIYRVTQTRPTYFIRGVIENTVDSRLHEIQLRKQAEINPSMKDTNTYNNLAGLLGDVVLDEDGNIERIDAPKNEGNVRERQGSMEEEEEDPDSDDDSYDA
ncbi:hypothetical protein HYFRA_00007841 [Hymenoscyphus fraxineus]|uniref:Uncharacterized protein n=1 Tax=Hymenoscyphus fraxineus TaxID=746836 RepID=A0A9N9KMA4_9HELO|nr:hypothetical protein HYFRA_00007841 [Hymenoscyphus fraxineus]